MIKVGLVKNNFPYADIKNGVPVGLAFELWDGFAKKNNLQYELYEYIRVQTAIDDVVNKKIDFAINPFSVTEKRLKVIDFSRAFSLSETYFFEKKKMTNSIQLIKTLIPFLVFLTAGIFIASRVDKEVFLKKLAKGIVHFFQYSYIIEKPKNNFHFIFNILFAIVSFIFSVFIIGFILNFLASRERKTSISNFIGKKIGFEEGTYFKDILEQIGMIGIPYTDKKQAVKDIEDGKIDAFVDDLYVLPNAAGNTSNLQTTELFRVEEYAFVMQKKWKYKLEFDKYLIEARESGLQKQLCLKNLGEQNIFCFL